MFIATTQLVEKAGRWEVSVVDVVMVALLLFLLLVVNALFFLFQIPVNDDKDKDADADVVIAIVIRCPARREEEGLCLVSMMAVRSLYC